MVPNVVLKSLIAGYLYLRFLTLHFTCLSLSVISKSLAQCFSNLFIPSPPFHSRYVILAPPSRIKQTQGSKFKEFYLKKVLNS